MSLLQHATCAAADALEESGMTVPPQLLEGAVQAALTAATGRVVVAMSDEQLEGFYRHWWAASYGVSPNRQAVSTAVAWGRHLVNGIAQEIAQVSAAKLAAAGREEGAS